VSPESLTISFAGPSSRGNAPGSLNVDDCPSRFKIRGLGPQTIIGIPAQPGSVSRAALQIRRADRSLLARNLEKFDQYFSIWTKRTQCVIAAPRIAGPQTERAAGN
jgi:hypothetical protein